MGLDEAPRVAHDGNIVTCEYCYHEAHAAFFEIVLDVFNRAEDTEARVIYYCSDRCYEHHVTDSDWAPGHCYACDRDIRSVPIGKR